MAYLADNALTCAGGTVLGDSLTAEFKINFVRPAIGPGRLLADAVSVAQGKTQAALDEYDAASLLNPSLATPHIEAAKVFSNSNDHPAAVVRGRKGVELAPHSDYAHYTLGVIYRRMERWP